MGLLDKIKEDVKKTGGSKGEFFYVKEGEKARVRFLNDMDEGLEVVFHDSFEKGINVPCQETFGKRCKYCDEEGLRTRSLYCWSVYDYEAKKVKPFLFAVNNCSPIPALLALHETYGTITDRDYVISVTGKQQNKSYSVIPMDKEKFRNAKAKALSDSKILSLIQKAYPADEEDDDDDYEEEKSKKRASKKDNKKSGKKSKARDEDDEWEDEDDDEIVDYSELSAKELYKLCKERDIDVAPRKSEKYYIKQLEEYDDAQDDWGDEDDEWEDEE